MSPKVSAPCRLEMSMSRTWGDELTLRACSDSFQVPIHVVQSTVDNWYLVYEPSEAGGPSSPVQSNPLITPQR